ncbi:hypothetical protein MKX01_025727 [Papaver californicum]|nr:hypothetical protein MKX01_025727 [Papaver californicum]
MFYTRPFKSTILCIPSEEAEIEVLQGSVESTISLQDSGGDIDQEEEDEEEEHVTLGFVEKPKDLNSHLVLVAFVEVLYVQFLLQLQQSMKLILNLCWILRIFHQYHGGTI